MPCCRCGSEFSEARARLGFDCCLECGGNEAAAEAARRARMIVPISHKSPFSGTPSPDRSPREPRLGVARCGTGSAATTRKDVALVRPRLIGEHARWRQGANRRQRSQQSENWQRVIPQPPEPATQDGNHHRRRLVSGRPLPWRNATQGAQRRSWTIAS